MRKEKCAQNDFAEVSKNLATDLKIILLNQQNNAERVDDDAAKVLIF